MTSYQITHRSLLRACPLTPASSCPAPVDFWGSVYDLDLHFARAPMRCVPVYYCRSCDEVIELRPGRIVTYPFRTSFAPKWRRKTA